MQFFNVFYFVRLSALGVAFFLLPTSTVFGLPVRKSSCQPDEYYDGIDKACVKCSVICSLPQLDFCHNNCPNFFTTKPTLVDDTHPATQHQTVQTSIAQPLTNPLLQAAVSHDVITIATSSLDVVIIAVISVSAVFILAVVAIVIVVVVMLTRLKSSLPTSETLAMKTDVVEKAQLIGSNKFERLNSVTSGESTNSGESDTTTSTTTSMNNDYQQCL